MPNNNEINRFDEDLIRENLIRAARRDLRPHFIGVTVGDATTTTTGLVGDGGNGLTFRPPRLEWGEEDDYFREQPRPQNKDYEREQNILLFLQGVPVEGITQEDADNYVFELKKKRHLDRDLRTVLHKPVEDGALFTDSVDVSGILPP
jgi:hypothetical protein